MTISSTTAVPDVPLPAGTRALDDWGACGNEYRIISTDANPVEATGLLVSMVATQLRDGSISVDDSHDAPLVFVDELIDGRSYERLTVSAEGARNLAAALVLAADELDGWAGR
jgi:hypothetical protein